MKMQRVINGKVVVRDFPPHLANSPAAKMGGWVPVQNIAVPVPTVAPVTPQDDTKPDPVERPTVGVASAVDEEPTAPRRRRKRITNTPDADASNA